MRKGVQGHGVRNLADGTLRVPTNDAAGALNLQRIAPERPADGSPEKRFLPGGRKSGLWHVVGQADGAPVLLLAEGYAISGKCAMRPGAAPGARWQGQGQGREGCEGQACRRGCCRWRWRRCWWWQRMLDVPLDAGASMGGIELLHGHQGPAALADALVGAAARPYGQAGRAWLEWCCDHFTELPALWS